MRSPSPSPPTRPTSTSLPERSPRTVTKLSLSASVPPPVQGGANVLATRKSPSCSDIDHWLSM